MHIGKFIVSNTIDRILIYYPVNLVLLNESNNTIKHKIMKP